MNFEKILSFFDKKVLTNGKLYAILKAQNKFKEFHMPKISDKASIILSLIFSTLLFVVLAVMAFFIPSIVDKAPDIIAPRILSSLGRVYLTVLGYLILAAALASNIYLFRLLLRVKKELVFSPQSLHCIRMISWGAMFEALFFLALVPYSVISFFISVAAFMLALALRVVKNVLTQAMEIKNENDYTI